MTVVQMMGGLGRPGAEVHGNDIARRMAQAFGARPRLLSAPGSDLDLLADPGLFEIVDVTAEREGADGTDDTEPVSLSQVGMDARDIE
jgi:hypothetical protein